MVARSVGMVILLALSGAVYGEGLVVTRAVAEPASVLPGTPFWISLTVTNSSERPLQLPRAFLVEVAPNQGTPFIAEQVTSRIALLPAEYQGTQGVVPPRSSRVVDFPTGLDLGDGFLFERRLWTPGKYAIRLFFSDGITDESIARPDWPVALSSSAVVSLPFELVVEKPVDSDAAVWSELMEATHNRLLLSNWPKGGRLALDLWERFPTTRYAPYLILAAAAEVRRNGGPERHTRAVEMLKMIEELDSNGVLGEKLRLSRSLRAIEDVITARDVESALDSAQRARAELESLSHDRSLHEYTRLGARHAAARIDSGDVIRARFRDSSDR